MIENGHIKINYFGYKEYLTNMRIWQLERYEHVYLYKDSEIKAREEESKKKRMCFVCMRVSKYIKGFISNF